MRSNGETAAARGIFTYGRTPCRAPLNWRLAYYLCSRVLSAPALSPIGAAVAEDVTPLVSMDRIEDVPSTKLDPFPDFDNFAWRAFVALNWPSLTDPAHRGVPDRAKTLR